MNNMEFIISILALELGYMELFCEVLGLIAWDSAVVDQC